MHTQHAAHNSDSVANPKCSYAQGAVNNALCFLGPHRKYNPFAQNFFELVPGQGHFGPDAIPGDVSDLRCAQPRPSPHPALAQVDNPQTHLFPPTSSLHRPAGAAASRSR